MSHRFEILHPGYGVSIQDSGRAGYRHQGIPEGGYMDRSLAEFANKKIGNDQQSALLEITLKGPKIRFHFDTLIIVAGQFHHAKINDQLIVQNDALQIKSGDIVEIGHLVNSNYGYLAIQGNIDVPNWFGSKSALEQYLPTSQINEKDRFIAVKALEYTKYKGFPALRRMPIVTQHPEEIQV